ncbi:MAG: dihydrofolate reductase family protein, partial [Candidatus Pacearchaeota archaeon]|nr:dihydrofolate reductase family protein [Candidatus Pacearchaeota archaeon]
DFLSDYDWHVFCEKANKTGCIATGRKTYDRILNSRDYNLNDIKRTKIIVVSKKSFRDSRNFYFVKSPKEAIKKAKKLGFKTILLCGGGKINSSFMKLGLVNEIFLNVDPVILSKGIKIFNDSDFEKKLIFLGVKKLKNGIIQLHYKVR